MIKSHKKRGEGDAAWSGILKKARDHSRLLMQWNNQLCAGFSNHEPWMMVHPNYEKINVESH